MNGEESTIEKSMSGIVGLIGMAAPFIVSGIEDRVNRKKLINMVMKNPSVANDFQQLVEDYDQKKLTMSEGEERKYMVKQIKKIGIDKLKKVAEEEMKKVPEMIDLPPVKKSEWFYLLKSER